MANLTNIIRKQLRIRPLVLAACAFVLAVTYLAPASGDSSSVNHGMYMVCDDFENLNVPNPLAGATSAEPL